MGQKVVAGVRESNAGRWRGCHVFVFDWWVRECVIREMKC